MEATIPNAVKQLLQVVQRVHRMDYYSGVAYNSQKKFEWTENTHTSNGSHQILF